MILIDLKTMSPHHDPPTSSLGLDCFISMNTIAIPDSPTFRVVDDDDKLCVSNFTSDLAINVLSRCTPSFVDHPSSTKQIILKDEDDRDSINLNEEDTSLILARNNLSTSFSKWEIDPEDGSFHNFSQLLFMDDVESVESEKKRVHFMADPNDVKLIFCQKYDCPIVLTDEDIAVGWYTATDVKKFRRHVQKDARTLRSLSSSTYMDKFLDLHRTCGRSISITQTRSQISKASLVAFSPHRGQESLIFFELFHADRKRMKKEILLAQAAFNDSKTDDELSELLGSVSKVLSRRSRRFAYIIGLGDADVAKKQISAKELAYIMGSVGRTATNMNGDDVTSTTDGSDDEFGHIEI